MRLLFLVIEAESLFAKFLLDLLDVLMILGLDVELEDAVSDTSYVACAVVVNSCDITTHSCDARAYAYELTGFVFKLYLDRAESSRLE